MAAAYQGRHSGEETPKAPAADPLTTTTRGFFHGFQRPIVSAAVILAVAGVSAAGPSEATTNASGPSYSPSLMALAQSAELSHNRDDTDAALATARRAGVLRAAALTRFRGATADAVSRSRTREAIAARKAATAAADRIVREQQRQLLTDRARSDPKGIGRLLTSDRGWGATEFGCLESLWTKESRWSWSAANSSGAYGIPQSLPGSKMSSAGGDWRTNPVTQIRWGLQYIANRYGTPCSAWSHSRAMNWY